MSAGPYEFDGHLDLGYGTSSDGTDVRLRVYDGRSGLLLAEIRVPIAVWGEALASSSHQPCSGRVWAVDERYGREHQSTRFVVPGINLETWADRRSIVSSWLESEGRGDEGWSVGYDDPDGSTASTGFNFHRYDAKAGTYEFIAHRYVEVES